MITFGEYFKRREQGETVTAIAKTLGVSNKAINRRLNEAGYVAEGGQWTWQGEGVEPLTKEMAFGKRGQVLHKQDVSTTKNASKTNSKNDMINNVTSNVKEESIINAEIKALITGENANKPAKVYKGIYFDDDIAAFLDHIQHGNKSELVNKIMRAYLRENDLI